MSTVQTVVVDEGSTQVKVCWINDNGDLKLKIIPSNVSMKEGTDDQGNIVDSTYRVDDDDYYVFDNNQREKRIDTNSNRYQVSAENAVLVHEALRLAGFGGNDVDVYVTLPVEQFSKPNGTSDKDRIQRKKDSVMRNIINVNGVPIANIKSCHVSSESIPAWYDLMINDDLEVDDEMYESEAVLVVDIGGTTTDIALINGRSTVSQRTTVNFGVFNVADGIRANVNDLGIKSISDTQMHHLLRSHEIRNQNVTLQIKKASRPIITHIVNEMVKFESDPASLDYIIIVGGGAALLGQDLADKYADGEKINSIIPDNPEYCIAAGVMKSKLYMDAIKAETEDA